MHKGSRTPWRLLLILIAVGTLAGLIAVAKRAGVEARNKDVEIGLEYDEVARLAQVSQQTPGKTLLQFRNQGVTSLIFNEDLLATLEQNDQAKAERVTQPDGSYITYVRLDSPATLARIHDALDTRGITTQAFTVGSKISTGSTVFVAPNTAALPPPPPPAPGANPDAPAPADSLPAGSRAFAVAYEEINLRSLGLGLPPEGVKRAKSAHFGIVGRVGNFAGVTPVSARRVLERLRATGAKMVIFNGDEVLGYRGQEKAVAAMLRANAAIEAARPTGEDSDANILPTGLVLGEVELSKQKGDEKLAGTLRGDYIRVHAIQSAELGQLDPEEVIDRFVRAARERNIRFCYVRLIAAAGGDTPEETPLQANLDYIGKIARGIEKGGTLTGGGYHLTFATRFAKTGGALTLKILFFLLGLGTAAGAVWAARECCPLPKMWQHIGLLALCPVCGLLAASGETGQRLVALLAGIAFPTVACLRAYPRLHSDDPHSLPMSKRACLQKATLALLTASAITLIGIIHVAGLLATRPFMLRANQFLGIKAQHAVPILIVAFLALVGGVAGEGENWTRFKARVRAALLALYEEPARFGILLIGLVALAAFFVIVARTGNDSGVGASGIEMKLRGVLDRVFPVRPRTKELLVGHPAFILALAWWWRGRRRIAIPVFVVGCIGQVSLLNTFCHIHTPLIVSIWHGVLGLVLGGLLGAVAFLIGERVLPPVEEGETEREEKGEKNRNSSSFPVSDFTSLNKERNRQIREATEAGEYDQ